MENSIYLGLSRQMVLKSNMEIVSNNIANMNTSGFRAQNMLVDEFVSKVKGNSNPLSFAYDYGQYKTTSPGSMQQTGNQLNVALNGPGFMSVQMANGQTGYTRDGNFQKSADGTLLTSAGLPVIGQGGPIKIPADSTEIAIDEKGIISNQSGAFSQLKIVEFDNLQDMRPEGNNLYSTTAPVKEPSKTSAWQGFIEGSNVVPVVEITKMIEILRDFQGTQKILETEHDRLRSAIQKLSQV